MAFANLAFDVVNSSTSTARNIAMNALRRKLSDKMSGSPTTLRFVYRNNQGWIRVWAGTTLRTVTGEIRNAALQEYKKLLKWEKKKQFQDEVRKSKTVNIVGIQDEYDQAEQKINEYGVMEVTDDTVMKDGLGRELRSTNPCVEALDLYGNRCYDALMLGIPVDNAIPLTVKRGDNVSTIQSKKLVWYDCTAMVSFNSTRNVVLTRVVGRDYSRKELISNGDIEFSVSGHILSNTPEVYPTNEVKKFIEIMRYKGIVEVNNMQLDQFNISKILIKDFSLTPTEGTKNRQDYSFSAVGIQPDTEIKLDKDTLNYIDDTVSEASDSSESKWVQLLRDKVNGIVQDGADLLDMGMANAYEKSLTNLDNI